MVLEDRNLVSSNTFESIRVIIDYDQIEKETDTLMCKNSYQIISWSFGKIKCRASDLMNAEKKKKLEKALNRVSNFLSKLLKTKRLDTAITVSSFQDIVLNESQVLTDLYIVAVVRPFGANVETLAAAFYNMVTSDTKRPVLGAVYINPSEITEYSDEEMYNVIFHEVCHILGISSASYNNWINPETGTSYGNSLPLHGVSVPKYPSKSFFVLSTPHAHQFAVERYNTSLFFGSVPSGILLEDGGQDGTRLSHPKGSVYYTEVMSGIYTPPSVISNLTLSLLADTGWYEVDKSLAFPFAWGDGLSMGIGPMQDFPTGPPKSVFPSHYLCNQSSTSECNWDFRSVSMCSTSYPVDCNTPWTSDDVAFCRARDFYDYENTGMRSSSKVHDYQLVKIPDKNLVCSNENNSLPTLVEHGFEFGVNSMCAKSSLYQSLYFKGISQYGCFRMSCSETGELSVYIKKQRKVCSFTGQELSFFGFTGSLVCPDPKLICPIRSYLRITPSSPSNESWSIFDRKTYLIELSITLILVLMLIMCLYLIISIICHRKIDVQDPALSFSLIEKDDKSV